MNTALTSGNSAGDKDMEGKLIMTHAFMAEQLVGAVTLILTVQYLFLPSLSYFRKIILYSYIVLCGTVFAAILGQFGTPILILGCLFILFPFKRERCAWNLVLFQAAWFWSVITDYAVTVPLRFMGFDFAAIRSAPYLQIIYAVGHALLSIIPGYFAGRWLHRQLAGNPDLIPVRMQWMLFAEASICSCIFIGNIICGSFFDFPTYFLLFNGFTFLGFTIVNFLIFFFLYRTMKENQRLALRSQAQESLAEYTAKLESHYQDMRRFKHDYMNLLSSINGYIQENDMEQLKDYFEKLLLPRSKNLINKDAVIAKLCNIKVLEVKGVLYSKLIEAMNLNLNITLELTDEITFIDIDLLILCRVLGIYLDNAIEASAMTDDKLLHIALFRKRNSFIFHLENSMPPLTLPLDQLAMEGMTSKKGHSGMGLSNAAKMLRVLSNISNIHYIENGKFIQVLTICDQRSLHDTDLSL